MRTTRTTGALLAGVLAAALAGCGDDASAPPPEVTVTAGPQEVTARPTQYCAEGQGQRYQVTPPVVEVSPDTPIALTVPEEVARNGWGVQVFDERLEERIGEVDVEPGTTTFDGINSSDVVPTAFYLVVVEDRHGECLLTGSWPIGFLRAGGDLGTEPTPTSAPASPAG
ncbi:Protein of unknown function [Geodermatophilus telluris]|uniref:DUF2771 domain-containing protein n=1 Tax=Geodermatophilus telluris TaxID=1190417 RepID=A0A1G6LV47_9ACTN|nr:DUF2771 family protein [Geodermatophilus telluris]SDC46576.1 Protein of unknown function [Geodermatophilus telluris]